MKKTILPPVLFLLMFVSCKPVKDLQRFNLAGEAQGTYYAITYFDGQQRNFQSNIDSLLKAVDESVSLWIDNSIISRVNAGDSTVVLDSIFKANFIISKEVSVLTNGYFDFTICPLAQAWGFHRKNRIEMTSLQVDSLRKLVDFRKVHLAGGNIKFDQIGMRFDFNAVAQGYTVDLIADFLDSKGVKHFLIDIGGEIVARNKKPDGSAWRVGIEKPSEKSTDDRSIQEVLTLENEGLATSGSYRKYFEKDGKRYSHAISPKTGYPVDHNLLSVTVKAKSAALADALATAFLVMGLEESKQLLEQLPDVDAFFIYWSENHTYETFATEGMKKLMVAE